MGSLLRPSLSPASADRIAAAFALRGSLSVLVPLVFFQALGLPAAGLAAAIAGLNTPLADSGGTYTSRLFAMIVATLVLPLVLFLGTQAHQAGWLVAALMAGIALAGGLARVFGQSGATLGLYGGLAFLIGLEIPADPLTGLGQAGAYFVGGSWSIALALALWRLRPWRRLEQELAGCFEAVAEAARAIQPLSEPRPDHEAERRLAAAQARLREAIEKVRATLGERGAILGVRATALEPFVILTRTASRLSGLILALAETPGAAPLTEVARASHEIAQALLARRPAEALSLVSAPAEAAGSPVPTLSLIRIHLANAEEALAALFASGARRRRMEVEVSGLVGVDFAAAFARVRTQITPHSTIFRHSLRVAAASALGVMLMAWLDLPHGIWVPLTALVVLQPNFGGTFSRALARIAGTVLGAGLAGFLAMYLKSPVAIDVALLVLVFGAFFYLRRRYFVGVFFLTPYVILLLSLVTSGPWTNIQDRVGDTLIGAALALLCGYFLWPSWERRSLPEQMAAALRAARAQILALGVAFGSEGAPRELLHGARRESEIALANAAAAFQRMLAEPPHHRRRVGRTMATIAYLQRLNRHLAALAAALEAAGRPCPELAPILAPLADVLERSAAGIMSKQDGDTPRAKGTFQIPPATHGIGEDPVVRRLLGQALSDITAIEAAG